MVQAPGPVIQEHGRGIITDQGSGVMWAVLSDALGSHDRPWRTRDEG